jgi:hypothetical protein
VNRSLTLGKSKIAQRFSAGYTLIVDPSPVGTVGVLPSLRDLASVLRRIAEVASGTFADVKQLKA